ncbi:AAEL011961-PA [Aedes aegypti]|uniref:AAEL011961-PA n=2 Tax=Aedes aegypti TaxID=7159 RepID=Q16NI3_AEDAE|nr:squamous cell carcinoma antigen recognized by T-cells 3 [Aedes aegypti]EAT35911.1 AAEL011961-PA [Aedes aegypti]
MSDAEMKAMEDSNDDSMDAGEDTETRQKKDAGSGEGSSSDSEMDDDDDDAAEETRQIKQYLELLGKIQEEKYNYDSYVQLLEVAHQMTDLDKIRQSAEIFAEVYPLSPDIWLRWLKIEVAMASSPEQIKEVDALFRRALRDYFSVEVAAEYANLAAKADKELSEAIWDVLIPTYGLHVTKGRTIFEAYREDFLEKNKDSPERLNRLARIYEQELKIPLKNIEDSYIEYKLLCEKYKDILKDLNPEKFERRYRQAKDLLQKMLPFEDMLAKLEPHCHQERAELYREYIRECRSQLGDDETQVLYERSVTDCCLDPTVWCDYLKYLDKYPPDEDEDSASPETLVNRALRNCPWSAELYVEKMRIFERERRDKADVLKIMEEVATVEFKAPEPAVKVWLEYLTYLRRHCHLEDEKERDILRSNFELAWNQLGRTWGEMADPECKILQFWGRLEYGSLGDPLKGRELWQNVMDSSDNCTRVGLWIEYAELESKRGTDPVRKVYRKAIGAVGLNDPETLAAAWMRFERCNGSLEQLASCQELCMATIEAYYKTLSQQRYAKGRRSDPAKGSHVNDSPKKKPLKRANDEHPRSDDTAFKEPSISVGPSVPKKPEPSLEDTTKRIRLDEPKPVDTSNDSKRLIFSNLSFEITEDQIRATFPELKFKSIELVHGSSGKSRGFGYVEFENEQDVQKALSFDRRPLDGRPVFISSLARDKSNRQNEFKHSEKFELNKLFVKGLPFEATNDDVRKLFEPYGKLKDVRVVYYCSSKGLAYVEYESEVAAKNAVLHLDQHNMNGSTITVAISAPPPRGNPTATTTVKEVEQPGSLGAEKRHLVKGDAKMKLSSMIPTALLWKFAAAGPSGSSAARIASADIHKSNEDFRKLMLKKLSQQ